MGIHRYRCWAKAPGSSIGYLVHDYTVPDDQCCATPHIVMAPGTTYEWKVEEVASTTKPKSPTLVERLRALSADERRAGWQGKAALLDTAADRLELLQPLQ